MSLTPANQRERADVIKRAGTYNRDMGSAAAKYINKIERQCRRSRLANQKCYVFENTLNCESIEDWFYRLDIDIQSNWNELKARFLKLQQPAEYNQELKWKGGRQEISYGMKLRKDMQLNWKA